MSPGAEALAAVLLVAVLAFAVIRPRVYQWSVEGLPARLWAELDLPIVLD